MDSQIGFPPWTSTGIFLWTGLCCRSWELLLERSSMYSYGVPFSFKAHITRQLNGLAHVPCSFTSSPMFERASNVVAIQLTMWFYNEQFSSLAWAISFVASNFFEVLQLQLKNWWLKSKEVCVSAYFPFSLHFCYFIYIYIFGFDDILFVWLWILGSGLCGLGRTAKMAVYHCSWIYIYIYMNIPLFWKCVGIYHFFGIQVWKNWILNSTRE